MILVKVHGSFMKSFFIVTFAYAQTTGGKLRAHEYHTECVRALAPVAPVPVVQYDTSGSDFECV